MVHQKLSIYIGYNFQFNYSILKFVAGRLQNLVVRCGSLGNCKPEIMICNQWLTDPKRTSPIN